jgi:hypothetical protein
MLAPGAGSRRAGGAQSVASRLSDFGPALRSHSQSVRADAQGKTMKKALGGCLVVALLALVVGGGALWWFVLRPAWNAGSEMVAAAAQWTELAQLEQKVENRDAFDAPADGVIPADTTQRFLAVQQAIDARMGDRLKALETKYDELQAQQRASGREPGLQQVMAAYGDLFGLIKEARLAQIDALNAQRMSTAEYRWARGQAYAALALAAMPQLPPGTDAAVAANAEALRAHHELLARTLATTWLDF